MLLTTSPRRSVVGALVFVLLAQGWTVGQAVPPTQQAGGVLAGEPKFRLVRVISGSKSSQQGGRLTIEDPRTIFYIPEDKQVIVYFEWEGPTGHHKFEGLWRNPEGKVAVISDFQYDAREKKFGGYWTLTLAETAPTGLWTLEARVDGEAAGTHTFQILATARPAGTVPERRVLPPAEIYQRALNSTVSIEKLRENGEQFGTGSGFLLKSGHVATAFQVIDGATTLRVTFPDGRKLETTQVQSWDRRQDWAILPGDGETKAALERAKPGSWAVGDRCYALDASAGGGRVILEGDIIGKQAVPNAGEFINISIGVTPPAIGSPLLNEYGEVIGLIGGGLIPGVRSLEGVRLGYSDMLASANWPSRGGLAVPVTAIAEPVSNAQPSTLADLKRNGQMIAPLMSKSQLLYGALARRVDRKGVVPQPVDQTYEFKRSDPVIGVFISWEPKAKIKSTTWIRVYDLDNRPRMQTAPAKIDLRPNQPTFSFTELPADKLPTGIYRLDLILGDEPAWRTFFRISD